MGLFTENTTMSGFYSVNAATHAVTKLISELKNPSPAAPWVSLGTEKHNALRKFPEIFQFQIISKTKLETTETQTRVVH